MKHSLNTLKDLARAAILEAFEGQSDAAIAAFDQSRRALAPLHVAQVDESLRAVFRELSYCNPTRRRWSFRKPDFRDILRQAMARDHRYRLLCLHAHDGYLREAVITLVDPQDDAARAVLLLRCNDWVAQVRKAALVRVKALLPGWSLEEISALAPFALRKQSLWRRGGEKVLVELERQPQWSKAVMQMFLNETNGPLARLLRDALKEERDGIDLPQLAAQARSAHVRAAAVQSLLEGQVTWLNRVEWVCSDRVYSRRRKVLHFGRRPMKLDRRSQALVMRQAVTDRSAMVRKLAADHVIRQGPEAYPEATERLRGDKSPAVRERMDFAKRKWNGQVTVLNE